ncbi:putative efflux pump outer membrane protein TtgC [termite gut metagenome]|uniref:Putative efflux pump outer membrane protein TtgC n=1 Tax=termite gut metagenome TaxID=433724 RepID=A0A5J4T0P3_9ZZZZ
MKGLISKNVFLSLAGCLLFSYVQAQEIANEPTLALTLDKALEIALNDNPTIKIAGQEIKLKKEANKEAYSGLFPEASLSGTYSRTLKKQTMVMDFGGESMTIKMGSDNSYNGGLSISLPLFAPALYKAISLTKTDVDLAVEKARSSKLDLINQVTKAYYQLLLAQDGYDVLQKSYQQAETNFEMVKAGYEQGKVSEYDKIRADVQVRGLKPTLLSTSNGVILAALQLKVLIGVDAGTLVAVEGNLNDYEIIMFRQELNGDKLDLANNSDLKQLDLNAMLLEKNIKIQQTNFMPTLGMAFNYAYLSLNNDFKFSDYKWNPYSTLGFSLTVPLFKASNFTKLRQTKIQMRQLTETRINVERQLNTLATSYKSSMNTGCEQVLSNKEGVFQAEKGREIARKRYEIGKGTILELNDSEIALIQAQLAYNQSIFDYLTAKADLDKVLGKESISE